MKEQKYYKYEPDYAVSPGEILLDVLDQRGISQAQMARRLDVATNTINRLTRGETALTYDMALKLERTLGVPASLWLNAETNYRLCKKRREERDVLEKRRDVLERAPIKEAIKRGYCEPSVDSLLRFFRVPSLDRFDEITKTTTFALRCSERASCDPLTLATWLQMGMVEAEKIKCASYVEKAFRAALEDIRKLTVLEPNEYVPRMKEICASCGVALVLVKELRAVAASGAARFINPYCGAILLNLRGKSADRFWFTFFHEAAHILRWKRREENWLVDVYGQESSNDEERAADLFAQEALIPRGFEPFPVMRSEKDVNEFSKAVGVHPGIIVGRLQHLKIVRHDQFNRLKQRIDWNALQALN